MRSRYVVALIMCLFCIAIPSSIHATTARAEKPEEKPPSNVLRQKPAPSGVPAGHQDVENAIDQVNGDSKREGVKQEKDQDYALSEMSLTTKLTIGIPGTIGVLTILWGIVSARKQAQLQAKLKALEILMSAPGHNVGKRRFEVVKKVAGAGLLNSISDKEVENDIKGIIGQSRDPFRLAIIEMLLNFPDQIEKVLGLWCVLFDESDALMKDIKKLYCHLGLPVPPQLTQKDQSKSRNNEDYRST